MVGATFWGYSCGMTSTPENPWASLAPDYLPVYGSRINSDSFEWDGMRWLVSAHDADGRPTQFAFEYANDGAPVVTVDGKPAQFRDIHSDAVRPATVAEWCDAISYWDTQVLNPLQDPRWSGESIEAKLNRVGANVVAYEDSLRNLANYPTPDTLEADLNKLFGPLNITVRTIDAWPSGPTNLARYIVDGEKDRFCTEQFLDTVEPVEWLRSLDPRGLRPYLHARFSGSQLMSFEAEMVHRASDLPDGAKISDTPSNPWWILIFDDQHTAMPVHHDTHCLDIHIDHDGQSIYFELRPTSDVAEERKFADIYERRWGHLMDDRHPPTDAEVENAIAVAHSRISN